jgi:hypothetical protein
MTIHRAVLALVVIAAAGAGSGGKAQTVDSPHQRVSNTSTLRIAPLGGQGPVQNIADLLNVRGTDAAIVPSDVLAYLRDGRLPGAGSSIATSKSSIKKKCISWPDRTLPVSPTLSAKR